MESDSNIGYSANEFHILRKAQEFNEGPNHVLSKLNIAIHPYTLFVFNKILLRNRDSIENILAELKSVNKQEILELLTSVYFDPIANHPVMNDELREKEVKYLNQYIIHISDLLSDDDY